MKNVSEIYTLNSLADSLSYGCTHGKFLDWYLRYHTKAHDYFVTNCNMSSDIWLVIVATRPYVGFPVTGRRLVILGPWQSVYNYIDRVSRLSCGLHPAPVPSPDDDLNLSFSA